MLFVKFKIPNSEIEFSLYAPPPASSAIKMSVQMFGAVNGLDSHDLSLQHYGIARCRERELEFDHDLPHECW